MLLSLALIWRSDIYVVCPVSIFNCFNFVFHVRWMMSHLHGAAPLSLCYVEYVASPLCLCELTLSSFSVHRKEESALVPTRPRNRTVCPTPVAGALACTGLTTAACVGTAAAAHRVARVQPTWPSPAPTVNASTGLWCSSSRASAATSATISTRRRCLLSDGSTETRTRSRTSGIYPALSYIPS